jgi:hypothetical protein
MPVYVFTKTDLADSSSTRRSEDESAGSRGRDVQPARLQGEPGKLFDVSSIARRTLADRVTRG